MPVPTVSVAVICMSGPDELARCLDTLGAQRDAPVFEIVAACDPKIAGIARVRQRFPDARIVENHGQRTPLELASRAVRECRGDVILITKDHCVPDADWVRTMVDAQREGRAAVGGRVEIACGASPAEWAFYFVDFFRYAGPVAPGPTATLTVCNVAYQRRALEAVRAVWVETFVETAVNDALRARFGVLWMHPESAVTMHRRITMRDALTERYAFGRLFGWSRLAAFGPLRRVAYAVLAPALPLLLLGRMAVAASRSRRQAAAFARGLLPLVCMVLARAWGEWLAYVTGRVPRSLHDAQAVSA